jgi:hypothetical protein
MFLIFPGLGGGGGLANLFQFAVRTPDIIHKVAQSHVSHNGTDINRTITVPPLFLKQVQARQSMNHNSREESAMTKSILM